MDVLLQRTAWSPRYFHFTWTHTALTEHVLCLAPCSAVPNVQRIRKYRAIPTLQSSHFYYIYTLPPQDCTRNARGLSYSTTTEYSSSEESGTTADCTHLSGGSLGLRPQDTLGSFSEAKKSYMQIHVIKEADEQTVTCLVYYAKSILKPCCFSYFSLVQTKNETANLAKISLFQVTYENLSTWKAKVHFSSHLG